MGTVWSLSTQGRCTVVDGRDFSIFFGFNSTPHSPEQLAQHIMSNDILDTIVRSESSQGSPVCIRISASTIPAG